MSDHDGVVTIPSTYHARTQGTGEYLSTLGFQTDAASFHTIKDLFYDFSFLNWRQASSAEVIFLTRDLHKYDTVKQVHETRMALKTIIPKEVVTPSEFSESLLHVYGALGYENDIYYDILQVRDEICERLRISDERFAELLTEVYDKNRQDGRIVFGVGPFVQKPPMGYSKKFNTLPRIFGEEPVTKVMVRTFGT
jgi:hypothetical protein